MISILRWSGTPSWLLCQQYTIFSETRKTSSVFSIYVMVASIIILGSLHLPRTAGHNIEEHWKDNVHRKKTPVIPAHEQRRSHGLHLSPRTFQNENNRISPNRSTTTVKKPDRTDKTTLHPTKGMRRTTKDDAMNADSFPPLLPSKGSLATKRISMIRKATSAPFWKSHEVSEETVSGFHARSTESSTPVINQKEFHPQANRQLTDNIRKTTRFQFTITPGQGEDKVPRVFELESSQGSNSDQPERNRSQSYVSNARSKVLPQQKILPTIILETTTLKVTPNQPVIDFHLSGEPLLSVITGKSKDKSSDTPTRNIESSTAKQDDIDSLRSSWSPFSSRLSTKFHGFQRNHMPSTPTQTRPPFPKKPNSHSSSFARDANEPIVSTVIQKRSSLTPIYMDKRIPEKGDRISPLNKKPPQQNNTGTSSPAPMTSVTTRVERKRQRRKKGRNKKKRRKMNKTDKKKQTSNPQPVSTDKDVVLNTEQINTTKKQAIEDQNRQRLETSSRSSDDSTVNPIPEIHTPKTATSLQVPDIHQNLSEGVDSDQLNEIGYTEITEGSVDDELARLEETQSEFLAFRLDRDQKGLKTNNKKQHENMKRLFRTGLPPDDHSDSDLPSQTNRSPSVRRFIKKKRKGRVRHRKPENNFFQKEEPTSFESSESSGHDQIEKDFSRLQFAKISTVLKTTVKRSARPVDAITPTPDKKKSVTDSKRWKFQLRKRGNKTNDSLIPNRETRVGDKTQSSSDSDTVKKLVVHSKGHSLFDHDGAARDEHTKALTMAEPNKQTTDPTSALYPLKDDNVQKQKPKTSSTFSENKSVSVASSSPISDLRGWRPSTQIGSYGRKDPFHTTTVDSSKIFASVSFAQGEKHPVEKKLRLLVTQTPGSITNDTTQVPSHFSSRIIRGTDGSKSFQRLPATASSNRDHDQSTVYKKRKTGASTEKIVNIPPSSTFASGISPVHTTRSPKLSSTEITPVQFTQQSAESRTFSQRSATSFKFTQHVTMSSRQTDSPTDNSHVHNGFKVDALSSSTPSTITTKDSSDSFTLHKEQRKTNETLHHEVSVKERSTSTSTRQESENASTPYSATSTPSSTLNNQSSETHSPNKLFPSTVSTTTKPMVLTHNSDTDESRLFVTSVGASDNDIKSIPHRVISHDDQHYILHPTSSSPPPFLTSSTSKSTLSVSSATKSVETRSYPETKSSFSTSSSEDIHKIITTSPLVQRITDSSIPMNEGSSVTNERQHNQHQSTTKPLTKQPQSTTTEPTKIPSTTFTASPTTKSIATSRKFRIETDGKTSKGTDVTTRRSIKENHTPTSTLTTKNLANTPGRKSTKNKSVSQTTLPINIITNTDELHSTPDSVSPKPKDDQPISSSPPDSPDYEELLVKCKVKSNIDINGNDFIENIKNGLVYSYLEGRILLNQRKTGSTNKRRKREAIGYRNIDTHAVPFVDTEGIEAKILDVSRREQLVEINFQMLEYGLIIATDTAIRVFSQLQITEISVNLHYPIYHQIEAIKHVMFQSQQPLKPSTTKWMMVTIAAPSIPVLCVICILLTSWYRNHARLRRKAMAEISRGSQYAESLADVGLEIDMEKGEIVSRAGSTSVLWTEFAAGDTLERMGMAGDYPNNTDGESSPSNSWNARGESRTAANQGGRGRRQSPVARQCQRSGKYVKKKDSISSFHFENNLEDEWLGCLLSTDYTDPVDLKNEWLQLQTFQKYNQQTNNEQNSPPVYESFEPALNDAGQWPKTSTLQSRTNTSRHLIDQQHKENSSKSQIYGDSVVVSSQKLRPTLHANIISHFLADLDTM